MHLLLVNRLRCLLADRPDMTIAVYLGRKATKRQQKQQQILCAVVLDLTWSHMRQAISTKGDQQNFSMGPLVRPSFRKPTGTLFKV